MPGAAVHDGVIENPALGFFGFRFSVPNGFELYVPGARHPTEYNDLQKMAIRIFEKDGEYHPRGNEQFYEGFLLLSEKTAVVLITLTYDDYIPPFGDSVFDEPAGRTWQTMPMYNVVGRRRIELGENRLQAVLTRGSAYEHKGWYYADQKRDRGLFLYEGCTVEGVRNDRYILFGMAFPEYEADLPMQMRRMIEALQM